MSTDSGASPQGGSSDEKSDTKTKSKVNTVLPEVITVQKDHMSLLLAKCRSQTTQLQAMKNLQLVIKDAYSQLEAEKKKSAKYQSSLIQAENRLTEMVRVQLENSALQHQLPFLADVQQKPVGKATRLPVTQPEQHQAPALHKSNTLPAELETDDLEVDGPSSSIEPDLGYIHSTKSNATSSSGYSSMKKYGHSLEVDGNEVKIALKPEEYEEIINKENSKSKQLQLKIKHLENLLEAKSNRNMDALVSQLNNAQKKIDSLTTAIKHKDTLLQNYYQAYMAITKEKANNVVPVTELPALENSSKDQLQQIILQMHREKQQIKELHDKELVEHRGLFLKEREKTHALEEQLGIFQQTIKDLQSRPSGGGKTDFPLTMAELRERNQYLEQTVKLHQHSSAKLSQEKERVTAEWNRLFSELDKVKKERTELETQVRQLSEKLSDPSNAGNTLRAKLSSTEQHVKQLQQEIYEIRQGNRETACPRCKKWEKSYNQLNRKCDTLQKHTGEQQELILSLQGVSHAKAQDSALATSSLAYQPARMVPASSSVDNRSSSFAGGADDEDMLECPRCCKAYPIEQVEKFQLHCQRCQDE